MRIRSLAIATTALASIFAASAAYADSLDVASVVTPTEQEDGAVFGVRGRDPGAPVAAPVPNAGPNGAAWDSTARDIATETYLWDGVADGSGVTIAIIDSGIDLDHEQFTGRVLTGACFAGGSLTCTGTGNSVGGDEAEFPVGSTHGTHVAGIAAGSTVGLATGASILPLKVCNSFSSSCPGNINAAVEYAGDNGAQVANLSLGGGTLDAADIAAFRNAIADGTLFTVSAGNSGFKRLVGGYAGGAAVLDGVRGAMIVVGASGAGDELASFSQVPGSRCVYQPSGLHCMRDYFVVAPGRGIISSVGGPGGDDYATFSGTSMSAPFVAGVAALILGESPWLTNYEVAEIIFDTAIPGPSTHYYGRGIVDINAALGLTVVSEALVVTGGSGGTQQSGFRGAFGGVGTAASGALGYAFSNSTLLKNAVLVDKWGRDFQVDLTNMAFNRGFSIAGMADHFSAVSPFAVAMQSSMFGAVQVSGLVESQSRDSLVDSMFLTEDQTEQEVRDFAVSASLMPGVEVNLGYALNLSGRFNSYDANASVAYDGLFFSAAAVNSPYAAFADGGEYAGVTIALADDLRLRVGHSSLTPEDERFEISTFSWLDARKEIEFDKREADSSSVGLIWDFADWGGLGVVATRTVEADGLLGGTASGAFSVADSTETTALGISARVGFGDGWVTTLSWSEGVSQLDLKSNSLLTSVDELRSRAYGIAVAKHGLFGGDALGIAVTRPVHVYSGGAELTAGIGLNADRSVIVGSERIAFASDTPQTDIELGYVTTFLDGALALQANAAYQMNVGGAEGEDSVALVSRAKIQF